MAPYPNSVGITHAPAPPLCYLGRVTAPAASFVPPASPDASIDAFIDALWLEDGLSPNTLAAYRRAGRPRNVLIARWMVAHTLRLLGRQDEALGMQQALASDWAVTGEQDPEVFDEIAEIHAARGDVDRDAHYPPLIPI